MPCPRAPNANSTTPQRIVTETYPPLATNPRDINLSGQRVSVNVTRGLDTLDQRTKFEAKQSGVTVALSSAVVSAVVSAVKGAAYNTYNQAKDLLKEPGKATDISVSVSLGSSKSSASSQDKSTTAVGSQVIATEDINLNADRDITLLAAGNTSEHRLQRASPCSWPRRARRRAFAEGLALVSR